MHRLSICAKTCELLKNRIYIKAAKSSVYEEIPSYISYYHHKGLHLQHFFCRRDQITWKLDPKRYNITVSS